MSARSRPRAPPGATTVRATTPAPAAAARASSVKNRLKADTGTWQRIGNAAGDEAAVREAGAVDVPDARRLVGLLAEPDRRRVVAAMILGEATLDGIARVAGLDHRTVVDALDRLVAGGLVEQGEP